MPTLRKFRLEIKSHTRQKLEDSAGRRNRSAAIAIALMWYLGLRISEVVKLRWPDLDFLQTTRPTATIRAEITKTKATRILPIPTPLVRKLEKHLGRSEQEPPLLAPCGWVVTHRNKDKPLTPRAVQYALAVACVATETDHLAPHDFRHSFATRLLRASNIRITQLALGHRSITSTAIYTHPTLDEIEAAMTRATMED